MTDTAATTLVILDARTTTPWMAEPQADEPYELDAAPPPGEPAWTPVIDAAGGAARVWPFTPGDTLIERAASAECLITNKTVLDADTLAALPDLRYVGLLSTGTNAVDLDAARDRGIAVTNVPAYSTASVAQHAFALLLELTNRVGDHDAAVRAGRWQDCGDFAFTVSTLHELAGRKLGVIGFGDIGQQIAAIGHALGMEVIVSSRTRREGPPHVPVTWVERDALLAEADVVSLSCPLPPDTERMIDAAAVERMKPGAWLINTGRGGLIDEAALAAGLTNGDLAGAGLDVLDAEPPSDGSPLIGLPNCVITPHVAWATQAARRRLMETVAANLRAFRAGERKNRVES